MLNDLNMEQIVYLISVYYNTILVKTYSKFVNIGGYTNENVYI